jgi:hypothetical protein
MRKALTFPFPNRNAHGKTSKKEDEESDDN